MPDIFGKEHHDYKHRLMLEERGELELAQRAWSRQSGAPPHNFNALGSFDAGMVTRADMTAQSIGFMTNNLQAVQAQTLEILYTEDRTMEMVPVKTDIPEGYASYSYRVIDRVGRGRFIDFDGSTAPSANVGVRLVSYPLEYAGILAEWTLEDLRRAMVTGIPLDTETIIAAMKGAMDHIESVAFTGDATKDFVGLTNLPTTGDNAVSLTTIPAQTGGYIMATSEPNDIAIQLQNLITNLVVNTAEVFGRTIKRGCCVYLPIRQAAKVVNTRLPDIQMTIWDFVKTNNSWTNYTGEPLTLKWLAELEDAAPMDNQDRMIIAVKEPLVMEMPIPIMPRITQMIPQPYGICGPVEYKIGGLNVKIPTSVQYVDNI